MRILTMTAPAGQRADAQPVRPRARYSMGEPSRQNVPLSLEELKQERPALPVLVLSMHGEDQHGVRAAEGGAAGHLMKHSAPTELVAAIRKVAEGGGP